MGAFWVLEPDEWEPSSPVLRGLGASNGARLLDPNAVTSELPVTLASGPDEDFESVDDCGRMPENNQYGFSQRRKGYPRDRRVRTYRTRSMSRPE